MLSDIGFLKVERRERTRSCCFDSFYSQESGSTSVQEGSAVIRSRAQSVE